MVTVCNNGAFIKRTCDTGHINLLRINCNNYDFCDYCKDLRKKVIYSKFYSRLEIAYPDIDFSSDRRFIMWTLGTNDNSVSAEVDYFGVEREKPYLRNVRDNWQLFRKKFNVYKKRYPELIVGEFIFYVIETGSAGYHHIHLISDGFIDHSIVWRLWRNTVGYNANVNFSYKKHFSNYMLNYVVKYLVKQGSRYYWLGKLYKAKPEEEDYHVTCSDCSCTKDELDYEFLGSAYYARKKLFVEGLDYLVDMHQSIE